MSGFKLPDNAFDYFPLRLYNISRPRETARRADTGSLGGTTAFYTPFDGFSKFYPEFPEYPVNNTPTEDRTGDDFYYVREPGSNRLVPANSLTSKPIDSASVFQSPLGFVNTPVGFSRILGGTPNGRIDVTDVPDTPPDAPEKYEDYLGFLTYSDKNASALLAQPTFRIPNVGLGLLAETDGAGHVTNVRLDMTYQGLVWRNIGVLNPIYDFLNRESILLRATMNGPAGNIAQDNELRVGKASDSEAVGTTSIVPVLQNPLSIGPTSRTGQGNAILDRLLALQPRDRGLLVAGFDTQLNTQSSRQLAAGQAGLEVQPNQAFRQNVTLLTQAYVATPPQTQPQVPLAQQLAQLNQQLLARQMDGKIPLVAVLPTGDTPLKSATTATAADVRPTQAVEDATSKKSGAPNPFLYFGPLLLAQREPLPQMAYQQPQSNAFSDNNNGSGAFQQGMFQQGQQNPFSGAFSGMTSGSGQQQPGSEYVPRKRPMAYVA